MDGLEKEEWYQFRIQFEKDKGEIYAIQKENAKEISVIAKELKAMTESLKDNTVAISSLKALHKRLDEVEMATKYTPLVNKVVFGMVGVTLLAVLSAVVAVVVH